MADVTTPLPAPTGRFHGMIDHGMTVVLVPAMVTTFFISLDLWPLMVAVLWVAAHIAIFRYIPWFKELSRSVSKWTGEPLDPWLIAALSAGATAVALFAFEPEIVQADWRTTEAWQNWHRGS